MELLGSDSPKIHFYISGGNWSHLSKFASGILIIKQAACVPIFPPKHTVACSFYPWKILSSVRQRKFYPTVLYQINFPKQKAFQREGARVMSGLLSHTSSFFSWWHGPKATVQVSQLWLNFVQGATHVACVCTYVTCKEFLSRIALSARDVITVFFHAVFSILSFPWDVDIFFFQTQL